jgi:hypothetical protein
VGVFLIVTLTEECTTPFDEVEEGVKMSSVESCPIQSANRTPVEKYISPLRRSGDIYTQFIFIRFNYINKICQASES